VHKKCNKTCVWGGKGPGQGGYDELRRGGRGPGVDRQLPLLQFRFRGGRGRSFFRFHRLHRAHSDPAVIKSHRSAQQKDTVPGTGIRLFLSHFTHTIQVLFSPVFRIRDPGPKRSGSALKNLSIFLPQKMVSELLEI
jgi:hypothetical protein